MKTRAIAQHVRNFVVNNYLLGEGTGLTDSESVFETGVMDSTGVLELVAFLQDAYGITVEDEELTADNIDSIDKISVYVHRKLKRAALDVPTVQEPVLEKERDQAPRTC